MKSLPTKLSAPKTSGQDDIVSWVHFGDLHMTTREEQNDSDLISLVEEVNVVMADSLNFAYLPGDNADHGTIDEYALVRKGVDRLNLPWFAIVGDHDVHSKSHDNFLNWMLPQAFYRFEVGSYCFFALDAFVSDNPGIFDISSAQLDWLQKELELANLRKKRSILFLHCYPSELGGSCSGLRHLIHKYHVFLIDMGHTHYNEIANDRQPIYTATRSTGQIEEGPVGFSVTNLDHGAISWRFKPLGEWPFVIITSPADERLITDREIPRNIASEMTVRVEAWSDRPLLRGHVTIGGQKADLERTANPAVWEAKLNAEQLSDGICPFTAHLTDEEGKSGDDTVRVAFKSTVKRHDKIIRPGCDKDNVVAAWPQHGILGTQLGPNKNGRKW